MMDKKRSIARMRRIEAYPSPKYYALLEDFMAANEMGRSETITFIVRHFFDAMPPSEIARIRSRAVSKNSS